MGNEASREMEKIGTNPYNILGVDKNSTIEDIKRAYKAKSKILHPDRNRNKTPKEQEAIELEYKFVNEAYKLLSDPKKRKAYDSSKTAGHSDIASFYNSYEGSERPRDFNPDFSQDPDVYIPKVDKFGDTNRFDANAFNKEFDRTRAAQPGDAGYGIYGEDLAPRMSEKDAKAGYKAMSKKLKPKKVMEGNLNRRFDANHFNAIFESQKEQYQEEVGSELIIRSEDVEGWGTFGGGTLIGMTSDVSTHNGLMVVGNDTNFGAASSVGGFYDYGESFKGPNNPMDRDSIGHVSSSSYNTQDYTRDNYAMSKSEFEERLEERQRQMDPENEIEPEETEEEYAMRKLQELEDEAAQKAEFTDKYARGQYPQHFLEAADAGTLDSRSNALLESMQILRLDSNQPAPHHHQEESRSRPPQLQRPKVQRQQRQPDPEDYDQRMQEIEQEYLELQQKKQQSRRQRQNNKFQSQQQQQQQKIRGKAGPRGEATRGGSIKDDFNSLMNSRMNDPFVQQQPPNTFMPQPRARPGANMGPRRGNPQQPPFY